MPENALIWLALLAGGVAIGSGLVGLLVTRRSLEPVTALAGMGGMALVVTCLARIGTTYQRADAVAYGFAFVLASIGGGYALASSLLDRLKPVDQDSPALPPAVTGTARAVIVAGCVEPDEYDPRETARLLGRLEEEELVAGSLGTMPFLYAAAKARYRALGGRSEARGDLVRLSERLEQVLPEAGFTTTTWATCEGPDALPRRVADLVAAGHAEIVVAQPAIAESLEAAAAKRAVDMLHPEDHGVRIIHAATLWDSPRLSALVSRRIIELAATPAETGVVLLGHGQSERRSHLDPVFDEHESMFLNRVRALVAERGVPEANIRVAWAEWRAPDVTGAVRHLAALGCRRIVVSPACFPFDDMTTRIDVAMGVHQARVEQTVSVVTVPAWRDDPDVVEAVRAAVLASVEEDSRTRIS